MLRYDDRGSRKPTTYDDRRDDGGAMRVIDLDTGDTLQAANDDDLRKAVSGFYEEHGEPMSDDDVAQLVANRAYDATDS
jgi:hypothetical protein